MRGVKKRKERGGGESRVQRSTTVIQTYMDIYFL